MEPHFTLGLFTGNVSDIVLQKDPCSVFIVGDDGQPSSGAAIYGVKLLNGLSYTAVISNYSLAMFPEGHYYGLQVFYPFLLGPFFLAFQQDNPQQNDWRCIGHWVHLTKYKYHRLYPFNNAEQHCFL
jgi:hypothetical protein